MQKPLREAINEVVAQWVTTKLQKREPVDVKFIAREMSLSLIEPVLEQDESHQGPLLAHILGNLSDEYLKRRGVTQDQTAR
jgi:hypothetical protein